jgi:iron complex outermembrane recepter protein
MVPGAGSRAGRRRRGVAGPARRVLAAGIGILLAALCNGAEPRGVLRGAIAPQPLRQALIEYSERSGLQLVYVSSVVQGKSSPGAHAGAALDEALSELLRGTGLRFEFVNARTVRILPESLPATAPR